MRLQVQIKGQRAGEAAYGVQMKGEKIKRSGWGHLFCSAFLWVWGEPHVSGVGGKGVDTITADYYRAKYKFNATHITFYLNNDAIYEYHDTYVFATTTIRQE